MPGQNLGFIESHIADIVTHPSLSLCLSVSVPQSLSLFLSPSPYSTLSVQREEMNAAGQMRRKWNGFLMHDLKAVGGAEG